MTFHKVGRACLGWGRCASVPEPEQIDNLGGVLEISGLSQRWFHFAALSSNHLPQKKRTAAQPLLSQMFQGPL